MADKFYNAILIDDEAWALRGLKNIVSWEEYGFTVTDTFTNSEEAFEAIKEQKPDVVFTDIRMPEINGMDLIEMIKDAGLHTELVIVSAYRDFEVAKRALSKGVLDYLMKPLNRDEVRNVLKRVREALNQRSRQETFNISACDFSSDSALAKEEVQHFLRSIITAPHCYLIVINHAAVPEVLSSFSGLNEVFVKGFSHAFLYSGSSPLPSAYPVCSIGISREYEDFSDIPAMLSDAAASLKGRFTFSENPIAAQIQKYLFLHYNEKISMEQLAEYFFLSESYIFELFRKNTGTTIVNFLKNIRLSIAAELLLSRKYTVKVVADRVGYSDVGYFGKLFRKKFDCTPEQYVLINANRNIDT